MFGDLIFPDMPLSVKPESVISGDGGALPTLRHHPCDGPHRPKGTACLPFNRYCRYPGLLGLGCAAFVVHSRHQRMPDRTACRMTCGIVWSRHLPLPVIATRPSHWPCSWGGSGLLRAGSRRPFRLTGASWPTESTLGSLKRRCVVQSARSKRQASSTALSSATRARATS